MFNVADQGFTILVPISRQLDGKKSHFFTIKGNFYLLKIFADHYNFEFLAYRAHQSLIRLKNANYSRDLNNSVVGCRKVNN